MSKICTGETALYYKGVRVCMRSKFCKLGILVALESELLLSLSVLTKWKQVGKPEYSESWGLPALCTLKLQIQTISSDTAVFWITGTTVSVNLSSGIVAGNDPTNNVFSVCFWRWCCKWFCTYCYGFYTAGGLRHCLGEHHLGPIVGEVESIAWSNLQETNSETAL